MSEHATSAEVGTALTDSSVVRPDNATEGVPSTATAGASDSNGVSATGNGTEPAADAGKGIYNYNSYFYVYPRRC